MGKKLKKWINRASWVLFIIYIGVLVYFLFLSERYGRTAGSGEYRYNLKPLKEIRRFLVNWRILGIESVFVNLAGNILAFVPFGYILPIISPKNRNFLHIFLLSLELTLTVEVMQLLLKVGSFDVDDILLNTLGGILGYGFFALTRRVVKGMGSKKT